MSSSSRRVRSAWKPIQSVIDALPLPESLKPFSQISPSPFVISTDIYIQLCHFHDVLIPAIRSLLTQYPQNPTLQHLLPLPPRIQRLLISAPPCSFLGSIRPELTFDHTGDLKLLSINSRFPFSASLVSYVANDAMHKETMTPSTLFAKQQLSCVSSLASFLPDLRESLTRHDSHTVWLITDDNPQRNNNFFYAILRLPIMTARSTQLVCKQKPSEGLFVKDPDGSLVQITSCIILLTENQLLSLEDPVLDALAYLSYTGHALNDLRTVFLVSHPRFLDALCSDAYQFDHHQRQTLRKSIILESSPPIEKRRFQIRDRSGVPTSRPTVVMLSSLDGEFYGPTLFSSTSETLGSFADGILSLPAMELRQIPHLARVWCKSFSKASLPRVVAVLKSKGLALVAVDEPLGSPEPLKAFVSSLDAILRYHKDEAVWNISPAPSNTAHACQAIPSSRGKFDVQTSLEFKVHTDCAFEELPPEWLVLATLRSDRNGGGMFSFAKVGDHVDLLTEDQIRCLLNIKPKVEAPPGFEGPDGCPLYTIGPVLMDRDRARFRYNNLNVELLTEDKASQLSEAFNALYGALEHTCDNNRMIVPQQTLLFLHNHKFVHARTEVRDPKRHLQRIRFDLPCISDIEEIRQMVLLDEQ